MPVVDLPVEDLRAVLELGLARGGGLLVDEERTAVAAILALQGPPARAYARLSGRVGRVWAVEDLDLPGVGDALAAVDALADAGLAEEPPWDARIAACTVPRLRAALRRLGLPRRGRRAELVSRLEGREGWSARRFVALRHRGLVRRLERFAFLRAHPDRSTLVVERLGHVRWPEYALAPGGGLFPDRDALLAWEAVVDRVEELGADEALDALGLHRAPGRLSLRSRLRHRVLELARERERAGEPDAALDLYRRLAEAGHADPGAVAVRIARCHEARGAPRAALAHLREVRSAATGEDALAVARTGRRVARSLGRSWAPAQPLREARRRDLRLPAGSSGARPRYRVGGVDLPVEPAVQAALAEAGRRALLAEGPLWSTLFGLVFAEAYFAPVPGALPVPYLDGPLDVGRPEFARARPAEVAAALEALREDPRATVDAAEARWRGVRLAGAVWERTEPGELGLLAEGLGSDGVEAVLRTLLERGWRARAGLPDLVLLPGEAVRLPGAVPRRLPAGVLLAEVKGPGDTLRDGQRLWLDRLVRAGVPVEVWHVTGA